MFPNDHRVQNFRQEPTGVQGNGLRSDDDLCHRDGTIVLARNKHSIAIAMSQIEITSVVVLMVSKVTQRECEPNPFLCQQDEQLNKQQEI